MKSYTTLRNLYGKDTKNTSTANLTYGDEVMNDFYRRVCSLKDWPFLHRLRTALTEASTAFVDYPYDVDLIESVYVTVGSTRYTPKPAPSRRFWDRLNETSHSSDTPEYWFPYNGQIGLYPQPSSAGNTISLNSRVRVVDLESSDYTTGTIKTATNGDETIVGNGTSWTSSMAGRWIKIDVGDTADSGDGVWYEISSVTDGTNLKLVRLYGGTSISSATQEYTMGQMPLLPEAYHPMIEKYAAFRYWAKENQARANTFKSMSEEDLQGLSKSYSSDSLSVIIEDMDETITNPNLTIEI